MTVAVVVLHGLQPRTGTSDPDFLQPPRCRAIRGQASPFPITCILFPGSVRHYLSLSVRIHDDKFPRRRGILPSILQVSVFVAEIPLLGGSSASDE